MIADDTVTESSQRLDEEESESQSQENVSADVKDEDFLVK